MRVPRVGLPCCLPRCFQERGAPEVAAKEPFTHTVTTLLLYRLPHCLPRPYFSQRRRNGKYKTANKTVICGGYRLCCETLYCVALRRCALALVGHAGLIGCQRVRYYSLPTQPTNHQIHQSIIQSWTPPALASYWFARHMRGF